VGRLLQAKSTTMCCGFFWQWQVSETNSFCDARSPGKSERHTGDWKRRGEKQPSRGEEGYALERGLLIGNR
jgi:hypothetical protein